MPVLLIELGSRGTLISEFVPLSARIVRKFSSKYQAETSETIEAGARHQRLAGWKMVESTETGVGLAALVLRCRIKRAYLFGNASVRGAALCIEPSGPPILLLKAPVLLPGFPNPALVPGAHPCVGEGCFIRR